MTCWDIPLGEGRFVPGKLAAQGGVTDWLFREMKQNCFGIKQVSRDSREFLKILHTIRINSANVNN
jgi:hypothetical protein